MTRLVLTNAIYFNAAWLHPLEKCGKHSEAWERYGYCYSDKDPMEWLPKIHQLDEESPLMLVYMNNHWQGQAVGTARQLKMLMEEDKAE